MTTARSLDRTYPALRTTEGGGFVVHRPFPTRLLMDFDPFLLLDEMGPVDYAPAKPRARPTIRIAASRPSPTFSTGAFAIATRPAMPARSGPATCSG